MGFRAPSSACAWTLKAGFVGLLMAVGAMISAPACAADDANAALVRVEARSASLLAVGVVRDDRMAIHLSHPIDNTPVRDAVVTVLLRGSVHPTVAEADGGYTLQTKDLTLPGSAAVVFQIAEGGLKEQLKGVLDISQPQSKPEDKNTARQLGWWVLNFAVCIGFLMLLSRRRKAAARD